MDNKIEQELNKLITSIISNNDESSNKKEFEHYIKFLEMSAYEHDLYNRNIKVIAGIDEAGRGPLAGPVVAAAVILPTDYYLPGLNDSKQLSSKKREFFYQEIIKNAISYGVGMANVLEIDEFNIYNSTKIAMLRAINSLSVKPMHLLIDAMKLDIDTPQTSIIKGDAKSISIAAASVIAKVTRDNYMRELDIKYPQYGFISNAGYGTKEHLDAINQFGIISEHRKTFEPVCSLIKKPKTLFDF